MESKYYKKKNVAVILSIMLFFSVLLSFYVSATATSTNPQLSLFSSTQSSSSGFDSSICSKSQDFAVQIAPLGCQPAVVRSDLLEQQDVQVYCPLSATKLNPLIDVNSINSISFNGAYPSEVSSIGFYPAQAALSTSGQSVNSPILSNIGYVVVNLKQQPNESSMPGYVAGNLTASLSYDAQNAFGLGNTNFYLPQLTDSQWDKQYPSYGFLNGKGYLRVDNIYSGKATISVYNSNLNKISTVTLSPGGESGDLSIPGFDFCSATMKLKLDSLSNPGIFAKLEVNGNLLDAPEGEKFLGNNCQVQKISSQGMTYDVQIACSISSGTQVFDLKTSPKIILNINGKNETFGLGDFLYQDNNRYVYLGYIGSTAAGSVGSNDQKNLEVVLVSLPDHTESQLSSDEISSIASLVGQVTPTQMTDVGFTNAIANILKAPLGITNLFLRNFISGENIKRITFNGKPTGVFNSQVQIEGYAQPQNSNLQNSLIQKYYQNATNDYQAVVNSYSSETYPSGSSPSLGEKALYQQMELALHLNQKNDLYNLCSDFKKKYPDGKEDISFCSNAPALSSSDVSSQYVLINGQAYQISLQGVSVPTTRDYGATIAIQGSDGKTTPYSFVKDKTISLDSSGNFVKLDSLTQNTATITTKPGNAFQSSSHVLNLNVKTKIGNYNFTLLNVNLSQMAQVSVEPKSNDVGSQANFTFNISIEKRLIQLTPDKIKEKISKVNKSIAEWEKISNATGKVLNASQDACIAASGVLTAVNFISNLKGTGLARTKVMESAGGWNDKCKTMVSQGQYRSLDDCFIKNAKQINEDVNQTIYWMNQQDKQVSEIQKQYTTKPAGLSGVLANPTVNTDEFMKDYSSSVQSSLDCLGSSITNPSNPSADAISLSDAKTLMDYGSFGNNNYNVGQAKNVQLYAEIICSSSSSDSLKTMTKQQLYSTLSDVKTNAGNYAEAVKTAANLKIQPSQVTFIPLGKNVPSYTYGGLTVKDLENSGITISGKDLKGNAITSKTPVAIAQTSGGDKYVLILDDSVGTKMPVTGIYDMSGKSVSHSTLIQLEKDIGTSSMYFVKLDASSYQNEYKSPEVKYFETAPYQGVPAIVPFDLKNGWYAAIKQTSPIISSGSTGNSVDSSGRVESFWLCNVGSNGLEEFDATMNAGSGGDYDLCQSIDLNTQSTYTQFNGLDSSETTKLVGQALDAIKQAQQQYHSGVSSVIINGHNIPVGTPAVNSPSIQCEDFMSPTSCNIMFNFCDPVVCPTSRCNFGGAFPVKDVVQTGILGSTLLCLPNWVPFGGTDYVPPVCLPGIQGGIDSFVSVQKSYEQCLQTNLATGKTTGICNEIWSLYGCNLFWQNAVPLAKLTLSKVIQVATGQGTKGGAEYLNVQNALDNAKNSLNYMTNSYASNSLKAFQIQSTQGVGVGFCKNFIQTVFPSGADLVNQISTTDSPPQYTGVFSETPYTTATVPPTSEYQVYYHIYAGKNAGAYYSVYLENSGGSYYQDTSAQHVVDSGYIATGGSADQTKDFTAPSGYTQLCISVNGNAQCGFKEVSTSLATNAIKDYYVANQANQTDITTENECRYGTIQILGASINIQSAPSLGITRICATENPGNSTDPNAGTANSRWVEVGYCGNQNLGCWLDTQSVENAINSPDIMKFVTNKTTATLQSTTLSSIQSSYASVLENSGKYLTDSQLNSELKQISFESDPQAAINIINSVINKVLYNNQKGELLLLRGGAYGLLALSSENTAQAAKQTTNAPQSGSGFTTGNLANGQACTKGQQCQSGYCQSSSSSGEGYCTAAPNSQTGSPASEGQQATNSESSITSSTIYNLMEHAGGFGGKECNCGTNEQCQNYATSLYNSATANSERPLLLLAIMMQESQCNADETNGNSIGLMQIDTSSVSDCYQSNNGISGVSSIGDVTGAANYDKNIQCGALILKKKNDAYGPGTGSHVFPAEGFARCSDGFTETYIGWNASIRGYNGYGCPAGTNEHYVDDVNKIYYAILNYLSSNEEIQLTAVTASANPTVSSSEQQQVYGQNVASNKAGNSQTQASDSCASAGYKSYQDCLTQQIPLQGSGTSIIYCGGLCPSLTSSEIANFTKYKSSFDTYSLKYKSILGSVSVAQFEALLVAIADENNWDGANGDWVMGYQIGDSQFQGSDKQVQYVADLLINAMTGSSSSSQLNYQTGKGVDYSQCNSQSDFTSKMKCILSIYHTGKTNYGGFWFTGIGANTEGTNYADEVMEGYALWVKYLGGSVSLTSSSYAPSSLSEMQQLESSCASQCQQYDSTNLCTSSTGSQSSTYSSYSDCVDTFIAGSPASSSISSPASISGMIGQCNSDCSVDSCGSYSSYSTCVQQVGGSNPSGFCSALCPVASTIASGQQTFPVCYSDCILAPYNA